MVDDILREDEEQTIEVEKENYTIGFFPEGELEVTTNGTYNVSSYATTEVDVQPNLQQKSVTITTNGTQTITADSGYDGLSQAQVEVNVGGNNYNVLVDVSQADKQTNRQNNNGIIKNFITEINSLNTTGLKNFKYFFTELNKITSLPNIDTSSATDVTGMFYSCSKLTTLPYVDISKCTSLREFANGCAELTELPNFDTSHITDFQMAFYYTRKITTAPAYDLSNATNITSMYANSNVVNVPVYNLPKVTSLGYWFSWCSQLSDESLNNIMASLLTATSYTGTKTLQYIFSNQPEVINKCTTLSNWTALQNAGWTKGI